MGAHSNVKDNPRAFAPSSDGPREEEEMDLEMTTRIGEVRVKKVDWRGNWKSRRLVAKKMSSDSPAALGYASRHGRMWKHEHVIPVDYIDKLNRSNNAITIYVKDKRRPDNLVRKQTLFKDKYRSSFYMSTWTLNGMARIGSGRIKKDRLRSTAITLQFASDQEATMMHRAMQDWCMRNRIDKGFFQGDNKRREDMKQTIAVRDIDETEYSSLLSMPIISDTNREVEASLKHEGLVDKKHTAILIDCGSGSTKTVVLRYSHTSMAVVPESPTVGELEVFEGCVAPAALDFLAGKPATHTVWSKGKLSKADLIDGFNGEDETLDVQDFVTFCRQQAAKYESMLCIVGTTAWSRNKMYAREVGVLVNALTKAGMLCKRIEGKEEGYYEAAAVGYAASRFGLKTASGVIACGAGSIQLSTMSGDVIVIQVGWREGKEALQHAETGKALKILDLWTDKVYEELLRKKVSFPGLMSGTLIAISAAYYAASIAGVDMANTPDKVMAHRHDEVLTSMRLKLEEFRAKVRLDAMSVRFEEGLDKEVHRKRDALAMAICNLVVNIAILEKYTDTGSKICFKREWDCPKIPRLLTTWGMGWYLHWLKCRGVKFESCVSILDRMEKMELNCVVFDCGTGQTKTLDLHYIPNKIDSKRQVCVSTMSVVPPVVDFLRGKKYGSETILCETSDPTISALDIRVAQPLTSDDFLNFAISSMKTAGAKTSFVGTSSWHRQDRTGESENLINSLTEHGLMCKQLDNKEEALFERVAVTFAAEQNGLKDVSGIFACGAGSVQISIGQQLILLEGVGWRNGKNMLDTQEGRQDPLKMLEAYKLMVHDKAAKYIVSRVKGTIIAIGASFYAAKVKGVDMANDDVSMNTYSAAMLCDRLENVLRELKRPLYTDNACIYRKMHESPASKKKKDSHVMNLCNLTVQLVIFSMFADSGCKVCFKRNWKMPGGSPFITSWTAGWYLSFLSRQGVVWPQTQEVIDQIQQLLMRTHAEGLEYRRTHHNRAADEKVAMRLIDLKSLTADLLEKARKVEPRATRILKTAIDSCGGRLVGFEYRFKQEASLFRKLIHKLDGLLKAYADSPAYTPTVDEICDNVDDCLRYTIVFPRVHYTEGVRQVQDTLARYNFGKRHYYLNYWNDLRDQTTYMGVNSWITTRLEDDPYTWELQIHTEESYELKAGRSHELYEEIRASQTIETRKATVYKELKSVWNAVPVPTGMGRYHLREFAEAGQTEWDDGIFQLSEYEDSTTPDFMAVNRIAMQTQLAYGDEVVDRLVDAIVKIKDTGIP